MATGDVFAVKLHMKLDAVECRPGFYLIEGTGSGDPSPTFGCAQAVATALGATPLAGFSTHVSLTGVEVQDVQPGTARSSLAVISPVITGTEDDDNPPAPENSMLLSYETNVKGVTGVFATDGRIYLPGIYSTGQISGFLISALFDALSAFGSLLENPFVVDGTAYQMACVSFTPNSNPRTIRATNPVVRIRTRNQTAIQRRRRAGRGI